VGKTFPFQEQTETGETVLHVKTLSNQHDRYFLTEDITSPSLREGVFYPLDFNKSRKRSLKVQGQLLQLALPGRKSPQANKKTQRPNSISSAYT
jgi:hypothetical protein